MERGRKAHLLIINGTENIGADKLIIKKIVTTWYLPPNHQLHHSNHLATTANIQAPAYQNPLAFILILQLMVKSLTHLHYKYLLCSHFDAFYVCFSLILPSFSVKVLVHTHSAAPSSLSFISRAVWLLAIQVAVTLDFLHKMHSPRYVALFYRMKKLITK